MAIQYFLAPNARWQGRDLTGQPVIGGKLYTYENGTLVPKATYQDKDGNTANANPVILDGKGEANIYWADDDLYTITLRTAEDQLVYTQDDYPSVGNDQDEPENNIKFKNNFIRNPQFTFWSNSTTFLNIPNAATIYDYCADDWLFTKTDPSSHVTISRQIFPLGQAEVPGSPVCFLRYECKDASGGTETNSQLVQRIASVQTFANSVVTPSIALKSDQPTTVEIIIYQTFGTGGSPSAALSTLAITAQVTSVWQTFNPSEIIRLHDIEGKTLGTNGGDDIIFSIKFQSNQNVIVDICNAQLISGSDQLEFDQQSQEDQYKRSNRLVTQALFTTGDVKLTLRSVAEPGWLLCNDGTIGSQSSGANYASLSAKSLYNVIWVYVTNQWAPVVGGRGVSSEADYNAGKPMYLTKTLGRVLATAGQAQVLTNFTADPTIDQLTIADSASFYYGVPVSVFTTGTLPAPLLPATTYYVWPIDATHVALATTPQNAVDGIPIDITTAGTGVHSIFIGYSAWSLGQFIGEEKHAIIEAEMPSHQHTYSKTLGTNVADPSGGATLIADIVTDVTSFTGGSVPGNNMQPTTFYNVMIKL